MTSWVKFYFMTVYSPRKGFNRVLGKENSSFAFKCNLTHQDVTYMPKVICL